MNINRKYKAEVEKKTVKVLKKVEKKKRKTRKGRKKEIWEKGRWNESE